jgi:hypothetical protein
MAAALSSRLAVFGTTLEQGLPKLAFSWWFDQGHTSDSREVGGLLLMNEQACYAENVTIVGAEEMRTRPLVNLPGGPHFTVSRWGDNLSNAQRTSAVTRLNSQIEFLEQHVEAFWATKDGRHVLQILNESLYGYSLVPKLFDCYGRLIDYNTYWINLHLLHQFDPEAAHEYDMAWQLLEILGNVLDALFDLRCHRKQLLSCRFSSIEPAA